MEDTRNANGDDVYAGHLAASGTVAVPEPASASELGIRMLSANPHHGLARFGVELPNAGFVAAEVIDPLGRRVRELRAGMLPAGHHVLSWDGDDGAGVPLPHGVYFVRVHRLCHPLAGRRLAAGVYFARLAVGDQITSQKLVLTP